MKIQRLNEALASKIAAGEVIERPASAVKELVENSLDAKSESIAVELEQGGIRCIVVRDNGEGMDDDDLLVCVERHATSKITREPDLDRIATLGFRGEALASIAAVSRMRIISRPRGTEEAHEVRVVAQAVDGPFPAARAPGTTVEARELFFNLPARARFLGTPRTEFLHANRAIRRLALARPAVSWSLTHGGKSVLEAPQVGNLLDRIGQLYGAEVARAMIPVDVSREDISVSGFISRPDLKRGNRRDQLFCVNGRPVSDRGLSYVLASAYHGILRRGSYPLAVICIDLPLEQVEVNVHPRKEEIRFAEPRRVQETLNRALQGALASRYVVSPLLAPHKAQPPVERTKASISPLELRAKAGIRRTAHEAEKVRVGNERRVIGQLLRTYLLVERSDGLEIVDQHIAHERILFERLRKQSQCGEVARQQFLLPVRVELSFESAALVASSREQLERVGIILEEFGGGTFLFREYPSLLAEAQSRHGFQELAERIAALLEQGEEVRDVLFDRLLGELACGAAIKAGARMPLEEQQALVDQLMQLENPYTCPHGRRIIFTVPKEDLDRRFQRT
ncbi:MAG TPA: DNA mismatch repair endonuclease MutL [Candidatus Heimdallarchaeota archaeon]|nr:DNA mismatch repair endonuclease MutL [Candidatus Heimdallarchaeota archaeon]